MARIFACRFGISGLAKTIYTPKSVSVVPAVGMDRNRSLVLGCCSVAGRSLTVLVARFGMESAANDPSIWPALTAGSSYSRCTTPVLCSLKSVKLGAA
jgi:hypothetical protein